MSRPVQTGAGPVDVLAVMDDAAHKLRHGAGSVPAQMAVSDELRQARTAVAELVEAARAELAAEDDNGFARERLAAALAKFGGAA